MSSSDDLTPPFMPTSDGVRLRSRFRPFTDVGVVGLLEGL